MDIERVNIVFNYDMPEDSDTYLHRVARAGRFGTKGLAITFVSDETDAKTLNDVQDRFDVNIPELPEEIDISSYSMLSFSCLVTLFNACHSSHFQSKDVNQFINRTPRCQPKSLLPNHLSASVAA